ncbi:MAG: hypothetical protein H7338_23870 [Candidatus Sericytochromatia bacterium]|nr:hypothetical protein [Candidatus Sericytochromatia bacterium]
MGASDAINALRSEAVSKSTLSNVLSDQLGTVNGDSQKQAGVFSAAKQAAEGLYNAQLGKLDGSRASLRQGVRGLTESAISMIFNLINAAMGGGGSALNVAADVASMVIDMKIMAEDILARDRTWDASITTGNYVKLYSPGLRAGLSRV